MSLWLYRKCTLYTYINCTTKCFSSSIVPNKWVWTRPFRCKCGTSSFFSSNNYWALVLFFFARFHSIQSRLAVWIMHVCWLVSLQKQDVTAGIMKNFTLLLWCWFFFFPPLVFSGRRYDEHFGGFQLSVNEIFRHHCIFLIIVLDPTREAWMAEGCVCSRVANMNPASFPCFCSLFLCVLSSLSFQPQFCSSHDLI